MESSSAGTSALNENQLIIRESEYGNDFIPILALTFQENFFSAFHEKTRPSVCCDAVAPIRCELKLAVLTKMLLEQI